MDIKEQKKALNECLESLEQTKKSVLEKLKKIEEGKPKFDLENWRGKLHKFISENNYKNKKIVYYCDKNECNDMRRLYFEKPELTSPEDIKKIDLKNFDLIHGGIEIIESNDKKGFYFKEEEKPKFNDPWTPKEGETYYFIDSLGEIESAIYTNYCCDNNRITFGNCFETYEQAEQRSKEIKVLNLLLNFSDANGGNGIFVDNLLLSINWKNKEVAEEALRRYKKELEELRK
jgi:hypothetical protein